VVLTTIPAVIAGALIALLLTGATLNLQSYMGMIMSTGVSVANAILIVTNAEKLRGEYRDARKAAIVKEDPSSVWARVYPQTSSKNGELARSVGEISVKEGWKIEELHTEEGRLDEVFRTITLPDTVKEGTK